MCVCVCVCIYIYTYSAICADLRKSIALERRMKGPCLPFQSVNSRREQTSTISLQTGEYPCFFIGLA